METILHSTKTVITRYLQKLIWKYYPPPYKHLVWDYPNANVEAINSAIEPFNWEKAFNGKDNHAQVALFSETLLKVFGNFIPNREKRSQTVILLGWLKILKTKLKNNLYRQYMKHQTQISSLLKVEDLRIEISNLITKSKDNTINVLTQN